MEVESLLTNNIFQAIFKEKEKKNLDVGKFLLKRLQTEARPNEADKYKLHVEEVDKITSLLLGLTSRLARAEIGLINLKKNCNQDEEVRLYSDASSYSTTYSNSTTHYFNEHFLLTR